MTDKTPRCIFLVESDKVQAQRLAAKLRPRGYRLITASGLQRAVKRFQKDGAIDLVLMDLDGAEEKATIQAVRDILAVRSVPVVFRSARCDPRDWKTIAAVPHYGCLQKGTGDPALPSVLDTAFNLFAIHQETRAEGKQYRKRTVELGCLFRISELFGEKYRSIDTVLREIAAILPSCLENPAAACARIVLDGRESRTENFKDTPWNMSTDIRVAGRKIGSVEVAYLEPPPEAAAECFLEAECKILNFAAERIGIFVEHMRAEEALENERRQLLSIFESIDQAVYVSDMDTYEILYANKALQAVFQSDPVGQTCYKILQKRETPCPFCTNDIIRSLDHKPYHWEHRNPVLDGHFHIVDRVIKWADGRDVRLEMAIDITKWKETEEELRKALQEKDVMMREIHHRVKNNMQVISSLLRLQAWKVPDAKLQAVLQASQERIRSMALVHDKLYWSSNQSHIDFEEYVRDLVDRLFHISAASASAISKTIDVSCVVLDIQQAIPCGLIVNELVTNSLKHAFPDGRRGSIRIVMCPDPNGRKRLVIEDDGVGLPAAIEIRRSTTLGLQIVRDLVSQLDGSIAVDRSRGTAITISF